MFASLITFFLTGCVNSMTRAIDSKELSTSVKMSDTIFLEPIEPEKQTAYIKVRNTSDQQGLSADTLSAGIAARLQAKGYTITNNPKNTQYRIDASILSAELVAESLTADAAVLGGFGGILGGSNNGYKGAAVGGILGAAAGAAIGSMFKVNNYMLIVDIQVSEKLEGGVQRTSIGDSSSGGATGSSNTKQTVNKKDDFYHHRTRIASTAKQTNLKFEEAIPALSEKLIASLSGIF
jgi:hypothetical protein